MITAWNQEDYQQWVNVVRYTRKHVIIWEWRELKTVYTALLKSGLDVSVLTSATSLDLSERYPRYDKEMSLLLRKRYHVLEWTRIKSESFVPVGSRDLV